MSNIQKIDPQNAEVASVTDMGSAMVSMFERVILDASVPVERIEKMMEMQERWEDRQAEKAFEKAIAAAKSEIKPIIKNRAGHNSKYADLSAIAKDVDPILATHGLSYRHETSQENGISVTCILSHSEGHKVRTTLTAEADKSGSKNSIQAIGSTITYLQRYTLVLSLGLATSEDDDGNAAGNGETITADQMQKVLDLIEDTETDTAAFCQYLKIPSIKEMPLTKFGAALKALEAKKAKGKAND